MYHLYPLRFDKVGPPAYSLMTWGKKGNMAEKYTKSESHGGENGHCESCFEKYTSCRWRVAYIALAGLIIQIAHRNCISLALVCMTKSNTETRRENITSGYNVTLLDKVIEIDDSNDIQWDSITQGLILSSYFYGQIVSPFISGFVCRKFGVRWPMTIYTLFSTISLVLIPMASDISPKLVIALRTIQGFLGSGCLPMYSHLWTHWAPKQERSQLISFTFSGLDLGVIVAFTISGWLCGIPVQNGWPFIFYTFGAISFLWMIVWCKYITDSPTGHPCISDKERLYILDDSTIKGSVDKQNDAVPWLRILTSGPVWGMITAMFTVAWGMTVAFSYLPRYLNDILHYHIEKNGILSALPFLGRSVSIIVTGILTDKIIKSKITSITKTRKLNQCLALFIGAAAIIPVGFTDDSSRTLAITLFVISTTALGGTMSGSYPNVLDLAPRYAATISGIAFALNGLGQLSAPMLTSWMTRNGTREEWKMVFCSVGGVYLFGGIVYALLGSGKLQNWNPDTDIHLDIETSLQNTESVNSRINKQTTFRNEINYGVESAFINNLRKEANTGNAFIIMFKNLENFSSHNSNTFNTDRRKLNTNQSEQFTDKGVLERQNKMRL